VNAEAAAKKVAAAAAADANKAAADAKVLKAVQVVQVARCDYLVLHAAFGALGVENPECLGTDVDFLLETLLRLCKESITSEEMLLEALQVSEAQVFLLPKPLPPLTNISHPLRIPDTLLVCPRWLSFCCAISSQGLTLKSSYRADRLQERLEPANVAVLEWCRGEVDNKKPTSSEF